jgi:hypothetical protein
LGPGSAAAVEGDVALEYRTMPLAGAVHPERQNGKLPFGRMRRCRVRCFTDGAVIGSRASFVPDAPFSGASPLSFIPGLCAIFRS